MDRKQMLKLLDLISVSYHMTGSRYICDPAPMNTDEDYVVLGTDSTEDQLYLKGFTCNTDIELYKDLPMFTAWRLGEFNIIVTQDGGFYRDFVRATKRAKELNLLNKQDRIELFQSELYGNIPVEIPF